MEQVLICTTQTIPTIAYVTDLLEAPMDLFLTEDADVTVWWPSHRRLPLYAVKRKQSGYAVNIPDRLDYTRMKLEYNPTWSMWYGEEANRRSILTLYSFAKLWNTIYPSYTLSGIVDVLETSDDVIKQEGEGLKIIINNINRMYRPLELFSTEIMMTELLQRLQEDFQDFYTEYNFDLINPTDKPDHSIFRDDLQWSNRIIVQQHLNQPYQEVAALFDCIYLDGRLTAPTEHQSIFKRTDIHYWWSIEVYPKRF